MSLALLAMTEKKDADCHGTACLAMTKRSKGCNDGRALVAKLVAAFEAFHPAGGVNYLLLAGEEWMALAA